VKRAVALTIAGSDSCGGAGIEADIKTMSALGVYGAVAVTSVTAQNTLGVSESLHLSPGMVAAQVDAVLDDIHVDAAKTGMLATVGTIEVVAERILSRSLEKVVVDPVMVATSGARLMREDAVEALKSRLLPRALVLTPNIAEASVLAGFDVDGREAMAKAGEAIRAMGPRYVLVKGGHLDGPAADVLCSGDGPEWFEAERVGAGKVHGTGCTLSAAIASHLARGRGVRESVGLAKRYVTRCIESGLGIGRGSLLLDHLAADGGGAQ